jgi:hypothetical protein
MSANNPDLPKIKVAIRDSSVNQDKSSESDLRGGKFDYVLTASQDQIDGLKEYVRKIQDGTDTSSVETAINAL